MMIYVRTGFIVFFLCWGFACSSESNTVNLNEKKPANVVQETLDKMIQPHMNALQKVKALEGKLQGIEQDRLKNIEAFDQ